MRRRPERRRWCIWRKKMWLPSLVIIDFHFFLRYLRRRVFLVPSHSLGIQNLIHSHSEDGYLMDIKFSYVSIEWLSALPVKSHHTKKLYVRSFYVLFIILVAHENVYSLSILWVLYYLSLTHSLIPFMLFCHNLCGSFWRWPHNENCVPSNPEPT